MQEEVAVAYPFGSVHRDLGNTTQAPGRWWNGLIKPLRRRTAKAHRAALRTGQRILMEPLEPRLLLAADLNPAAETAIGNGLNTIADFADDLDQLSQFASSLPVVNDSIGVVF